MTKQEQNLTRQSFFNTFSAFMVYGVHVGCGFFVNMILVGTLGSVSFGAWQIGLRLLTYVVTGEGPTSQALKWVLANKRSKTDEQGLRRFIGSAHILWSLLAVPILISGTMLAWFAPRLMRDVPTDLHQAIRLMAFILVIRLLVTSWSALQLAVLQGMNLVYRATWWRMGVAILSACLLILAANLNLGLPGLAGALLATGLVSGIVFWRLARIHVPWFGVALPRKSDFVVFSAFGGWMWVWALVNRSLFLSDVIILGWVQGAATVTTFIFSQYILQMGVHLIVLMAGAVAPGLGKIVGQGDLQRAQEVRSQLLIVIWLMFVVLGTCIFIWNESLIGLWVGADRFAGPRVNALLVTMFLQMAFIRADAVVIDVTLDVKRKVLWGVLASLISISLALMLALRFGMEGMIWGLIGGRSLLSVLYPILVGKALQVAKLKYFLELWRPALVTIGIFVPAYLLGSNVYVNSWLILFELGLATVLMSSCLAFYTGLNRNQRSILLNRVKQIGSFRRSGNQNSAKDSTGKGEPGANL